MLFEVSTVEANKPFSKNGGGAVKKLCLSRDAKGFFGSL